MRALLLATAFALTASGVTLGQDRKAQGITAEAITWDAVPPVLPKGAQLAVLSGDPGKSGPFTVRLRMPAGYKIPAHQHPHGESITVISGELSVGMGDKLDEKVAQKLGPGGFVDLPANINHFAFANVETIIQINSPDGPFAIKYANPTNDPSKP